MCLPVLRPNFIVSNLQVINTLKLEIMKWIVKNAVMCMTVLLCALAFSSCEKEKSYDIKVPMISDVAWPDGSMLSFMNGSVNIDVLPGAVTEPLRISVAECYNGQNCDFMLKVIHINPEMSFNGPVNISLKCNGELANGAESFDGCNLAVYCWDTKEDFFNGTVGEKLCCTKDENNHTVRFCVKQTGVFAVGITEPAYLNN